MQRVDVVDLAKIQRIEIGFRTEGEGAVKMVPVEAEMLTGDENIVEAQMIVQYQVADPEKYLFKLADPEATLRIAANAMNTPGAAANPSTRSSSRTSL